MGITDPYPSLSFSARPSSVQSARSTSYHRSWQTALVLLPVSCASTRRHRNDVWTSSAITNRSWYSAIVSIGLFGFFSVGIGRPRNWLRSSRTPPLPLLDKVAQLNTANRNLRSLATVRGPTPLPVNRPDCRSRMKMSHSLRLRPEGSELLPKESIRGLAINELRQANNAVKHQGKVSPQLAAFPGWNLGEPLTDCGALASRAAPHLPPNRRALGEAVIPR
jgi:hypothetical protein